MAPTSHNRLQTNRKFVVHINHHKLSQLFHNLLCDVTPMIYLRMTNIHKPAAVIGWSLNNIFIHDILRVFLWVLTELFVIWWLNHRILQYNNLHVTLSKENLKVLTTWSRFSELLSISHYPTANRITTKYQWNLSEITSDINFWLFNPEKSHGWY